MIAPGRVFRNEEVDASHEHTFYQLEGMMMDRDVSVAHLIYFMKTLLCAIFHRDAVVRLRPGYFPFVEPGFELDIQCLICGGPGCPGCKHTGWVELLPCGLVHPERSADARHRSRAVGRFRLRPWSDAPGDDALRHRRYSPAHERRSALLESIPNMKFSYKWIRELVDGLNTTPAELARLITLKTAECEGVETHGTDSVIEVDNKSLTHRPDLWGHHGMAREVAAITGKKLLDPVKPRDLDGPAAIHVDMESYELSPRYSALVFENVTVKPSPPWLAERLEAVGLNAINNIVDVTNFVMAEIAQPMHAFDADKLDGDTIFVRSAKLGEEFVSLSEEKFTLDPSFLSSLTRAEPLARGRERRYLHRRFGIHYAHRFREREFQRHQHSQNLFAAEAPHRCFHAFRKSHRTRSIPSGAFGAPWSCSNKFPREFVWSAVSPDCIPAHTRAAADSSTDRLAGSQTGPRSHRRKSARFSRPSNSRSRKSIRRTFSVFVPSWRATKDVSIKDDLVEEVGRMIGYDSITPVAPLAHPSSARQPAARIYHRAREMAAAQGFTEVYNYSFLSEETARVFDLVLPEHVGVTNPIASDQTLMRRACSPEFAKTFSTTAGISILSAV